MEQPKDYVVEEQLEENLTEKQINVLRILVGAMFVLGLLIGAVMF